MASTSFNFSEMFKIVNDATQRVKERIDALSSVGGESIDPGEMFKLQMMMNQLSQLSEMTTSVMSAANTSISSMARNVKS